MKNKVISLQFVVMHRLSFKLSVLSSLKNQIELSLKIGLNTVKKNSFGKQFLED